MTETRSDLQIYREVIADAGRLLKEDVKRTWRILRGTEPARGDGCQMAGCDHSSIGSFPHPDSYRDDLDVCRKHWVFLHAGTKAAILVLYGLVFGLPLALLWMVML